MAPTTFAKYVYVHWLSIWQKIFLQRRRRWRQGCCLLLFETMMSMPGVITYQPNVAFRESMWPPLLYVVTGVASGVVYQGQDWKVSFDPGLLTMRKSRSVLATKLFVRSYDSCVVRFGTSGNMRFHTISGALLMVLVTRICRWWWSVSNAVLLLFRLGQGLSEGLHQMLRMIFCKCVLKYRSGGAGAWTSFCVLDRS